MLRIRWLLAGFMLLVSSANTVYGQISFPATGTRDYQSLLRMQRLLDQKVTWEFEGPLGELVERIGRAYRVSIALDVKSLEGAGMSSDTPVSSRVSDITLRAALRGVVRPFACTWCVRDEFVIITTQDEAETALDTRVYPIADLLRMRVKGRMEDDYESIISAIQKVTGLPKPGWVDDGGVGEVEPFPNAKCLLISTTAEVHEQIEGLIGSLRRVKRLQGQSTLNLRGDDRQARDQRPSRHRRTAD